jgi:hypothetical protein
VACWYCITYLITIFYEGAALRFRHHSRWTLTKLLRIQS